MDFHPPIRAEGVRAHLGVHPALCAGLLLAAVGLFRAVPAGATDAQDNEPVVAIWRPLVADPREAEFKMQWVTFHEDWRYGTNITDPASHGGYVPQQGVYWDVAFGGNFHVYAGGADHDTDGRSTLHQVGLMAAVFGDFAKTGAMLTNADYQIGPTADLRWGGHDPGSVVPNGDACWSMRAMVFHRSTHLGDEYLSQGAFGDNQAGADTSGLFLFPPVKRVNLSFQAARLVIGREVPLGRTPGRRGVVRAYAGGELKLRFAQLPKNFRSPVVQLGLEYYSREGSKTFEPSGVARALNVLFAKLKVPAVTGETVAGVDVKLAKPYNFAGGDNPAGGAEVWTPHLFSEVPYGREYRHYAASWHGMAGFRFFGLSRRDALYSGAPSVTLGWQFYSGYSPNGQFLDQRLSYRPALYAMPSISLGF
jgi:hypothetical protein